MKPGFSVLLAEDDGSIRDIMSEILFRLGAVMVTPCANGLQALNCLTANEKFDLVVTDNGMPIIKGVDLIDQARVLEKAQKESQVMPIIMLSGDPPNSPDLIRAVELGAYVLTKPVNIDALRTVIDSIPERGR